MALIWADNFEMYGARETMADGIYATVSGFFLSLGRDSSGAFLDLDAGQAVPSIVRLVLPEAETTVGQGGFIYCPNLPTLIEQLVTPLTWKSANNTDLFSLRVLPSGQLQLRRGSATGTILGTTTSPVISAAANVHIEAKITVDPFVGIAEVRVRGRTVLLLENIDTGSTPIQTVEVLNSVTGLATPGRSYQWRHWTVWNDKGAVNNSFLGQVMVYWNKPVTTFSEGGWSSSAEVAAHETLSKPLLANQLTSSGGIVNSDTVRIQNIYYRWTSSAPTTGAGTSANPWLVALGADSAESLKNMYEAINASGIPGTTYSPDLVEHPLVKGFGLIADAFCVVPKVEGTTTMTFSETGAALAWTSTTTFLYRVWDPIRMSAGYTPAVKATGFLTFSGNPLENDTAAVGGTSFTFKASPTGPTDVAIGGSPSVTATNLATAIGLNVSTVTAEAAGLVVDITAVSAGALGNTISLASTSAVITTSDSTLEGGEDITYPDPFVVGLTPLPDDVTSIRAVIPVVRAAKLDGGDGNIQVSFGTLNTNYDVGPDTPITNAMTYWGNATDPFVSEINPDTGTPWTPGEFNLGARIRVARTK